MDSVRRGRQSPTFSVIGDYDHSDGEECVEMFESYGFRFMPNQKFEMNLYLARNKDGSIAAKSIGCSRPRQNGKSFGARFYSAWMAAVEGKSVLYSAHNGKTVRKMFKQLCVLFNSPELYSDFSEMVSSICKASGSEGIYLNNGACIEFATRTNNGSRGGTYSVIVADEAQEITDVHLDALLPTISASDDGDPQIIYIGTPPNEQCNGTVFSDMHRKAHSDDPGNIWWIEWAVDEIPSTAATTEELVDLAYETNPGLGYRVIEDAIRNEAETMSREGYARERLGWWKDDSERYRHAILKSDWNSCSTENPPAEGKLAFGVKFSIDGTHASVAACIKNKDAPLYVELIDNRDITHGTGWLVNFLASKPGVASCFLADGRGTADTLVENVRDKKCPRVYCRAAKTGEVIQAAASFVDLVSSRSITHFCQDELTDSAVGASRRTIGNNGAFGFGDAPNVDSTPIEAAALAVYAVNTCPRDPTKKQAVKTW